MAEDPRYATNALRLENQQALKEDLSAALAAKTAAEWLTVLRASGIPCGPIHSIEDVVGDPQVAARNMLVEVDDARAGRVKLFGSPIKLSAFDDPYERDTAPALDENREGILADFTRAKRR
jgi:CoA:oxalate CoA-transferase